MHTVKYFKSIKSVVTQQIVLSNVCSFGKKCPRLHYETNLSNLAKFGVVDFRNFFGVKDEFLHSISDQTYNRGHKTNNIHCATQDNV